MRKLLYSLAVIGLAVLCMPLETSAQIMTVDTLTIVCHTCREYQYRDQR